MPISTHLPLADLPKTAFQMLDRRNMRLEGCQMTMILHEFKIWMAMSMTLVMLSLGWRTLMGRDGKTLNQRVKMAARMGKWTRRKRILQGCSCKMPMSFVQVSTWTLSMPLNNTMSCLFFMFYKYIHLYLYFLQLNYYYHC